MKKPLDIAMLRVPRTAADHEAALAEIERLLGIDPAPGTPDADRLELLGVLVHVYEDQHYPMATTTSPQSAVSFRVEQLGMMRSDLDSAMGGKSRVSEFFKGRRPLSMTQVMRLRNALGIPTDLLIPKLARHGRAPKRAPARTTGKRPSPASAPPTPQPTTPTRRSTRSAAHLAVGRRPRHSRG